eukprot:354962-Chlamydomonas_euryale.AAC.2
MTSYAGLLASQVCGVGVCSVGCLTPDRRVGEAWETGRAFRVPRACCAWPPGSGPDAPLLSPSPPYPQNGVPLGSTPLPVLHAGCVWLPGS